MPPEKPSQSLTASLPATRRWKRSASSPSPSPSCRSTVSIQLSCSQLSSLIVARPSRDQENERTKHSTVLYVVRLAACCSSSRGRHDSANFFLDRRHRHCACPCSSSPRRWADRRRCCCAAHHPASRVPRGCAYAPLMGGQRRRLRAARRWTRFERVAGEAAGRTQSNCSSGSRPRANRFPSLCGTRCSPRAVSASAGKSRSSCWSGWAPQPTPSHTTRCCTRCDGPSTTMRRWACGPRCTRPTPTPSTTCSRSAARLDGGPRRRRCWQGWSRCGSLVGKWPMSPRGGATARPPGLLGQTPQARTCSAHALRTPEEHSSRSALQEERRCRRQRRPIR